MSNRRTNNWATLLAVGLPLIVAGCAGAGNAPPPTDPAALAASKHVDALTLAEKLKSEGNYASAVTMYQQAHQAKPTEVRPLIGMGDSLLGVGANAEAANAYASALAIDPNNLDALRGLGHARILLGQPQFAVTQYQTALKIAPHDARSLNGLGVAQDTLGDHAAAQANYRAVLATDPNNQSAKNNLALSLALSGDNAGAIKILEDVSKSATATAVNRQNLALIYGAAGQVDQAQQLSHTDLPADANRNINAIGAETDPAKREELLKQSLGIELQGRQYTPPAAPAMPLTNLAQASVNDDPVYLSTDDSGNGSLPMITTGKPDNALTAETAPAPIVKKHSSGDKWSDNWDEELVDAADLSNSQPNQPVVATPSKAAEQPLPAAPASTTTVVAATNADTTAAKPAVTDTTITASAATPAAAPAAAPAPSTPTPLLPQTASTTNSATTANAMPTSTAATSIPSKFMSSSKAIGDDKPAATADAGPASSATPAATPSAPTMANAASAPSTASPVTASSEPAATPPAADAKPTETAAPTQVADSGTASTAGNSAPSADPAPSKPATVTDAAGAAGHADTATASTPAVTTTSVGSAKVYTVQIASYRSEAEATVGWQTLTTEQKDLLSGLPHTVEKADLGAGKGVYYRLKAGAFADAKAAKTLCTDLKNHSIDCMVVEAAPASAAVSTPTSTQQSMLAPKWINVDPSALAIRTSATA